ncbi:MAG: cytochrome c [Deferrisomatales bacterium]
MRHLVVVWVVALAASACVLGHVRKDIPPPGGCDRCHRHKISGNWEVVVSPVQFGREGGIPEDQDIVLRELRRIPYHKEVPAKRLTVFAAAASREVIGDEETGIQCFVCHRSPGPPHEKARGTFDPRHHPWKQRNETPAGSRE